MGAKKNVAKVEANVEEVKIEAKADEVKEVKEVKKTRAEAVKGDKVDDNPKAKHYEGNLVVSGAKGVKAGLSKEGKAIIVKTKKMIAQVGKISQDICKELAHIDDKENKFVIKELGVSKASLSQMKKAGSIYNAIPLLTCVTHTNVVELAPLFKDVDSNKWREVVDEFTFSVFGEENSSSSDFKVSTGGDNRIERLAELSQRKLREAVKDYLTPTTTYTEVDGDDGNDDGDGDGNDVKKPVINPSAMDDLEEILDKYKVSKPDKDIVRALIEKIVNEAFK